jgi:hypothetical protein
MEGATLSGKKPAKVILESTIALKSWPIQSSWIILNIY